MKRFCWNI